MPQGDAVVLQRRKWKPLFDVSEVVFVTVIGADILLHVEGNFRRYFSKPLHYSCLLNLFSSVLVLKFHHNHVVWNFARFCCHDRLSVHSWHCNYLHPQVHKRWKGERSVKSLILTHALLWGHHVTRTCVSASRVLLSCFRQIVEWCFLL